MFSDPEVIKSSRNFVCIRIESYESKENQDIVERIKSGEDKLVGFLVGQLMKQSNGSVNPGMAKELLLKELEG